MTGTKRAAYRIHMKPLAQHNTHRQNIPDQLPPNSVSGPCIRPHPTIRTRHTGQRNTADFINIRSPGRIKVRHRERTHQISIRDMIDLQTTYRDSHPF
ncbi:hypothetical protein L484_008141 [Morus notabilis]|uniref:Uncharacterized protein n=1 Tax=Morus notabilis TaxID=981085 RepID=W9RYA2_9ROSA|nr:hypothetical protein L484_008141 [Morus notabilis]